MRRGSPPTAPVRRRGCSRWRPQRAPGAESGSARPPFPRRPRRAVCPRRWGRRTAPRSPRTSPRRRARRTPARCAWRRPPRRGRRPNRVRSGGPRGPARFRTGACRGLPARRRARTARVLGGRQSPPAAHARHRLGAASGRRARSARPRRAVRARGTRAAWSCPAGPAGRSRASPAADAPARGKPPPRRPRGCRWRRREGSAGRSRGRTEEPAERRRSRADRIRKQASPTWAQSGERAEPGWTDRVRRVRCTRAPGRSTQATAISSRHALDQRGGADAAATAHRHEARLLVGALELVQQGRDQSCAGGPERVPERHRASVHVDPVHVWAQLTTPGRDHGGERLVDLDQVDVVDLHRVALEDVLRGRDRAR